MHAIFAADAHINGSRGNVPFGNKGKLIAEDELGRDFIHEGKKYF